MPIRNKIDFESLLLQRIPVTIGDKHYTLTEANTETFVKYRSAIFSRSTIQNKGRKDQAMKFDGLADMDVYLLSLCLTNDETGRNVSEGEIRTWPSRITEVLLEQLKLLSGLQTEEEADATEDEAKNSPSDGTDGSV